MNSHDVLFVPTYNYLSVPIIKKLASLKRSNTEIVCLDFYQPRANFGLIDEKEIFQKRTKIYPSSIKPNLFELRRLRDRLIYFLDELNPKLIITFSDVTFFARCIKGTRFETRLLVIQPCLLSTTSPSWTKRILYNIGKIVNKLLDLPVFREKHYWGESLDNASYYVWSKVEQKSRQIRGRVSYCGNYFMDLNDQGTPKNKNLTLVIVPDLPYYTRPQLDSLLLSYSRLLATYPETIFEFKYHPLNRNRLPLVGYANYREARNFSMQDTNKYEVIVSAYSNLAVTLRCKHQKIIIFDLGGYVDSSIPYINQDYFVMVNSGKELIDKFLALKRCVAMDASSNEYMRTFFTVSSDCLVEITEFFSHSPNNNATCLQL